MGGLIDDRNDELDELEVDEELDESEVVDNDDGVDLGGNQDEEVDAEVDEELDTEDEEEVGLDEGEEQDEPNEEDEDSGEEDEEVSEEEDTQPSAEGVKIAELERQLEVEKTKQAHFDKRVKETLELLGVPVDGNVMETLDRISAESEGKTLEEYRKEKDEKAEIENAKQLLARQRFEQLCATDLAELKKSFPDLLSVENIRKCFDSVEDFAQFGKLRDSGVSAKNAYMAVNGDKVRTAQAQAVKNKAGSDGKRHITSVAPKKASDNSVVMPKAMLVEWRESFPELSDAEIRALYKQTL